MRCLFIAVVLGDGFVVGLDVAGRVLAHVAPAFGAPVRAQAAALRCCLHAQFVGVVVVVHHASPSALAMAARIRFTVFESAVHPASARSAMYAMHASSSSGAAAIRRALASSSAAPRSRPSTSVVATAWTDPCGA